MPRSLSPLQLTSRLDDEAALRLARAMRGTLIEWTERLRARGWRGMAGESDGVSTGDGGARSLPVALSRVRHAGPAHTVRRE